MATEKITENLGIVTAFGYAKAGGYTGDEKTFQELMGTYASTAEKAKDIVLEAEGFALGTQDGVPVESDSKYYENNAAYYAGIVADKDTGMDQIKTDTQAAASAAADSATDAANAKRDAENALQQIQQVVETIDNIEEADAAAQRIIAAMDDIDAETIEAVSYNHTQDLNPTQQGYVVESLGLDDKYLKLGSQEIDVNVQAQIRENINSTAGAVRFDIDQTSLETPITPAQQAIARANINSTAGAVMYNKDMTAGNDALTNAQKKQARQNIGADTAVRYDVDQTTTNAETGVVALTDEQKNRARQNIGVVETNIRYDIDQTVADQETGRAALTLEQKATALKNIGADKMVRFDADQTRMDPPITAAQQAVAQNNIGLSPNVVRFDIDQTALETPITPAQQAIARKNIGASSGAVRYDIDQTVANQEEGTAALTDAQKERARTNIGVRDTYLRYDTDQQGLSATQKTNALTNLGMSDVVQDVVPVEGGVRIDYTNGTQLPIAIETNAGLAFDSGYVDEDNLLHLTLNGEDIEDFTPFAIPAGGGGGDGGGSGNASITRISPASVDCIYGDTVNIIYSFAATDSGGDTVGNGTGTWSVGGVVVSRNNVVYQGQNVFNITPYITDGANSVKLSVTVDTGGSTPRTITKSWSINAVNMYFTWNYDDTQINTTSFVDRWVPYGDISKTTHTLLDGVALETSTTTRSGSQQSMTIPMQTHGVHTLERWLSATIGNETKYTAHQYHEAIFAEEGVTTPVVAISMQSGTLNQYDTVQIPIVVYDPVNLLADVELSVNGSPVGEWNLIDRSIHYWNYTPTQPGTHVLTVSCGNTSRSITMTVVAVQIDVQETSGYTFKFKASDLATNNAAMNWDSNGVTADYSENFDWINGGLHTETDSYGFLQQYFCIKAGTRMTINHQLFASDPKTNGMTFKIIFKVVNCRNYDAQIAHCYSDVGIRMYAHEAIFNSLGTTVSVPYGEDEYIELEFDVYPAPRLENDGNYRYLMAWMDGVITSCRVYGASDNFVQPSLSREGIVLGSDDCDLYVYMVKAYPMLVTRDEHIDNFIMDAPNASEMVRRFNRNDILDEQGAINYEKLIEKNPDCRVWLYDIPYLTNDKSDKVSGCQFHQFWSNGDRYYEMSGSGKMSVQGTSSVQYIRGAANTDINFSSLTDGYGNDLLAGGVKDDDYGGNYFFEDPDNPDHAKVFTAAEAMEAASVESVANLGPEWVVVTRDASNNPTHYIKALGMKLNDNSCPISYSNTKVNFASCEQVNNMCNAAWYQRFNPYPSLTARDCMEFNMGVQFIKDSGTVPDSSHFVLWGDNKYHMYSIANMGNSKKNVHVFHDLSNPLEVCIEVNDNNAEQMRMINDDLSAEDWGGKVYFGMRYPDTKNPSQEVRDAWQRLVSWMASRNPSAATNEPLDTPETYGNYTFRGHDRAGTQVLRGTVVTQYAGTYTHDTFERRMARMLSECEDYMVMDSFMYHYVYLERHTMVDNVSKNNFWSSSDLLHWDLSKAYDMDTSDGNNNQGQMVFDYGNEWNDMKDAKTVFNGGDSVWFVFCANLYEAAREMFINRETAGAWSATAYHNFLLSEQQKVPERCWVQCYWYDYLRTYEQNLGSWMTFLDGGQKTHQRKHFEFFEELYDSSKYRGAVSTSQNVNFRAYRVGSWGGSITAAGGTPFYTSPNLSATTWGAIPEGTVITITNKVDDNWREVSYNDHTGYVQISAIEAVEPESKITLTMYNKMYIAISSGTTVGELVKAERGIPYAIDLPVAMDTGGSQIVIYTAPMIQAISGLEHLFPDTCNFTQAVRLRELTIGSDTPGYANLNMDSRNPLELANNTMLERLYAQNLPNAAFVLDLTHCPALKYLDATGSGFTGYSFADGGLIETAIINSPTSINLQNLTYLEDENFSIADMSRLVALRHENTPGVESLDLVNAASSLQIIRLIGINWVLTSTALLDALLDLQGYDEANRTISQSVLSGSVYVPAITQRKLDSYNTAWPNLTVTYASMTQQYAVHFVDYDGTPILDRRGNEYVQYIDRGAYAYDPIAAREVAVPTRASDAQYNYTFSSWDGIANVIIAETTIQATYDTELRTYTVRWFAQPGDVRKTLTDVPYGSEVAYDDDPTVFPELADEEETFVYKLFTGWDKSTGFITEDTDVYAQWDRAILPSPGVTDLKDMTVAQISGVAKRRLAETYWTPKDYVDIKLGKDFSFSNINEAVLAQDLYLDGTNQVDTGIQLFNADSPTFTLAIDCEFSTRVSGATILSCYNSFTNGGFRLSMESATNPNPYVYWGADNNASSRLRVSYGRIRFMVVIRHIKGSSNLYVAGSNPGDSLLTNSVVIASLTRARNPDTDSTLILGGIRNTDGNYEHSCNGVIHWCKIWYGDLGYKNIKQLAEWIHETVRMEYTAPSAYRLAGDTTDTCSASFIANNCLYMRSYVNNLSAQTGIDGTGNIGGWSKSWLRSVMNDRFYLALPYEWQQIIKLVKVNSTLGDSTSDLTTTEDRIYLPSYGETMLVTTDPYRTESGDHNPDDLDSHRIRFFTNNQSRMKFVGFPTREDAQHITGQTDPTILVGQYVIRDGDIWYNSNNSGRGYMYVSQEIAEKHGYIAGRLKTDQHMIAQGEQGGLWITCQEWWERTASTTNNQYFYYVRVYGDHSTYYSTQSMGIVPCFSI